MWLSQSVFLFSSRHVVVRCVLQRWWDLAGGQDEGWSRPPQFALLDVTELIVDRVGSLRWLRADWIGAREDAQLLPVLCNAKVSWHLDGIRTLHASVCVCACEESIGWLALPSAGGSAGRAPSRFRVSPLFVGKVAEAPWKSASCCRQHWDDGTKHNTTCSHSLSIKGSGNHVDFFVFLWFLLFRHCRFVSEQSSIFRMTELLCFHESKNCLKSRYWNQKVWKALRYG